MKLLLFYLSKYKKLVVVAILFALINQGFSLLDPIIFGKLIGNYAANPLKYNFDDFIKGAGLLICASISVAMVSRIAKAFQDYFVSLVIQSLGADMYTDGLKHTLKISFSEFEDQRSGETLNVLQKVRTDTEKFITIFINVLFFSVVGIVFVIIYAIQVNSFLIIIYLVSSLILATITNYLSKKIKKVQTTIVAETRLLAGTTTESLRNIELVKSLGLTNQETRRLHISTKKILQLELKKVRSIRSISFVQGTFVNTLRQAIMFFLMYLVFKGELVVAQIITLQFFSFFIFNPLQEMGNVILSYREAEASLTNFQKILASPIEVKPLNPKPLNAINTMRFENVVFQHKTASFKALNNISFSVNKGETIAFVGPSGSGKSTLVKLLVGLYTPLAGNVIYNNINYNEINIDELRNQLGFVTQDTQLFSGTIKENLLFVKPNATEIQINEALDMASCNNLLARSEKGIETVIGEGGMKLSGGEKQRLSIARSLLRKPNLLVFDEATSALDSITEEEITTTIQHIGSKKEQITVLIAHRLSTIMHADKIFVLEKGEIIETGKHDELVQEKGLYYAMWRQQIGERK
ncbi:MAG: ABC transporter ATP-binding protein/permease [Bacteroidia bacterium]|nr:ABC transporter ATP-binding protein/permease [Bacteroidia bacterium]